MKALTKRFWTSDATTMAGEGLKDTKMGWGNVGCSKDVQPNIFQDSYLLACERACILSDPTTARIGIEFDIDFQGYKRVVS